MAENGDDEEGAGAPQPAKPVQVPGFDPDEFVKSQSQLSPLQQWRQGQGESVEPTDNSWEHQVGTSLAGTGQGLLDLPLAMGQLATGSNDPLQRIGDLVEHLTGTRLGTDYISDKLKSFQHYAQETAAGNIAEFGSGLGTTMLMPELGVARAGELAGLAARGLEYLRPGARAAKVGSEAVKDALGLSKQPGLVSRAMQAARGNKYVQEAGATLRAAGRGAEGALLQPTQSDDPDFWGTKRAQMAGGALTSGVLASPTLQKLAVAALKHPASRWAVGAAALATSGPRHWPEAMKAVAEAEIALDLGKALVKKAQHVKAPRAAGAVAGQVVRDVRPRLYVSPNREGDSGTFDPGQFVREHQQ